MDPQLEELRRQWWALLASSRAEPMDAGQFRMRLRQLVVTDANGTVWRVDPQSSAQHVRFTRQMPGRIAEPADPAAFVSPLGEPTADDLRLLLDVLLGPNPASAVAAGNTTRRTNRGLATVAALNARGARLRVAGIPRQRRGTWEALVGIVEADGQSGGDIRVELVAERGAWKLRHWI